MLRNSTLYNLPPNPCDTRGHDHCIDCCFCLPYPTRRAVTPEQRRISKQRLPKSPTRSPALHLEPETANPKPKFLLRVPFGTWFLFGMQSSYADSSQHARTLAALVSRRPTNPRDALNSIGKPQNPKPLKPSIAIGTLQNPKP